MSILSEAKMLSSKDLSKFGSIKNETVNCFHQTQSLETAEKIGKSGFHLRNFGKTAKMFNAPEFLWKYDPIAVYALVEHSSPNETGNFVELAIKDANVLRYDSNDVGNIKRELFEYLECKGAKDFSDKLKDLGIDAIAPMDNSSEVIIVNLKRIEVIKVGMGVNPQPPKVVPPAVKETIASKFKM
ncbi:hypothetical protein OTK49_21115 [Vibrio coralliirubri]|uniref:hypothetical protein n=1 Tax=Vibrio coralliirubri TaxID=1516159 RepID=UPI0022852387|nr:hypothetical protein [Vibrio coralliirubri]MCY9865021.1 hypothetical protein [Vibrio coralliirubri]